MCTVTLIRKETSDFILTSNRDESPNRLPLSPQYYTIDGVDMVFPKDKLAGGTWVGMSAQHRIVCLLNGGFVKHKHQPPYGKSRGVVVKELLGTEDVVSKIETYDFTNIEPFTVVIVDWSTDLKSYELVWTGKEKSFKVLSEEPRIWSSSTLYTPQMQTERKEWFQEFVEGDDFKTESILNFHKSKTDNTDYGFIMDRDIVKTTSITQIEKVGDVVTMAYRSLMDGTLTKVHLQPEAIVNE